MSEPLINRVVAAIGRNYELDKEIGRGGMSVVFRARDLRLNRPVAIKVLPPELAYDPAIRMRFTREAQTSAHLNHPHIVPIYDVGESEGIAYLVMAYVTGGNLGNLLARDPRQSIESTRRMLCEVADALAYAHQRGIIHRDIKPDNILLDGDSGRAMVTDFGIARAMEAGSRLTGTGVAVGTPAYMSPEQAVGEREVDGRSDIYSLGVLAYQMLTGRVPFTGGNTMALLLKHVSERPKSIEEYRPDAPRPLRNAIERALMKDPEDRWPSATAFREALTADDVPAPAWRAEQREPVRYPSPRPESREERSARDDRSSRESARAGRPASPKRGSQAAEARVAKHTKGVHRPVVMEPEHLASLTPEQRKDLRLWHGRVNLYDRIKAMRGYVALTLSSFIFSGFAIVGAEDIPPLGFFCVVPLFMSVKMWKRGGSLRRAGVKMRRVLLMPRAKWVLPAPPPGPDVQLEKISSKEILESPHGTAIRKAAEDRAAIMEIIASLSKADRALLPDLAPTVKALVERVAEIAKTLHSLEQSIDVTQIEDLDARIESVSKDGFSPEGERRLQLLRRQRATLDALVQRRAALARQLDSAGLALGNLRLDLIKFRSSGLESALNDVSTATQEAKALSRDIDGALAAAAEVRNL